MPPVPSSLAEARDFVRVVIDAAAARGIQPPEPPQAPFPYECCGRGCERCVYIVYYSALDRWARRTLG